MVRSILGTGSISNVDISSETNVASYISTADGYVLVGVWLTGLNAAAATLTLRVSITRSSTEYPCDRDSFSKHDAADTTFARPMLFNLPVQNGDVVTVYATSTNSSDTSISGEVTFDDVTVSDALQISDTTVTGQIVDIKTKTDNLPDAPAAVTNIPSTPTSAFVRYSQQSETIYSIQLDDGGNVWNGTAFVTYDSGDLATYVVTATEVVPTIYQTNLVDDAVSRVVFYRQAGGSPEATDQMLGITAAHQRQTAAV